MSVDAATLAVSLYGQGSNVVGRSISSPWFPASWRLNQGWGPTSYELEPEGHGYAHWHSGIDVGLDCGTDIHMPAGLYGVARWVDNPGGYGTALRIELYQIRYGAGRVSTPTRVRTFDVWLGHLRQRLVADGQEVGPGDHLAVSNNTGNSSGCHLHFEVRPAGAKYGSDVDPSRLLLTGSGDPSQAPGSDGNPYNPLDPRYGLWELENQISGGITQAEHVLLALGQAALGTGLLVTGLAIVAYALQGKSLGALRADTIRLATRASKAHPERAQPAQAAAKPGEATPEPSGAEAARQARLSRVRVTHQRELTRRQGQTAGTDFSPEAQRAVHAARYGRGGKLSPAVSAELRARPTRMAHPRRGSFRLRPS